MNAEVAAAWAAGLFEGEGSSLVSCNGTYTASLSMTDEDVVRRFAEVVGFGTVSGPYYPKNPKWAPHWRWQTTRKLGVRHLLELFRPWLSPRRVSQLESVAYAEPKAPGMGRKLKEVHADSRPVSPGGGS